MGEISRYLRQTTVDWNKELLPDAAEPLVSISCGSIREAAARIEALEAVLRPFAAFAAQYDDVPGFPDDMPALEGFALTLGDLRRARAALEDK